MNPPSAPTAEAELISSVVIDPSLFPDYGVDSLPPEAFYVEKHRYLWKHLTRMYWDDVPIDLPGLVESLRQAGELVKVGGFTAVVDLVSDAVGVGANAPSYAKQIDDVYKRRLIIEACLAAAQNASTTPDHSKTLSQLDAALASLGDAQQGSSDKLAFELAAAAMNNQGSQSTGYGSLDRAIGGFPLGDLTILAGRTSMGKSAFLHGSAFASKNALVLTPDQPKPEIFAAEASRRSGVSLTDLRAGRTNLTQQTAWKAALASVRQDVPGNITFRDGPLTLTSMTREVKRAANQGRELVFVDHIQRIRSESKSQDRRTLMVEITGTLKDLAREYGIAVVAASQLKREIDEREDKRPILSDLSESKSIEEDANLVLFLYRDKYYSPASPLGNIADIIVAKHKTSERLRVVQMVYEEKLIKFKELKV